MDFQADNQGSLLELKQLLVCEVLVTFLSQLQELLCPGLLQMVFLGFKALEGFLECICSLLQLI